MQFIQRPSPNFNERPEGAVLEYIVVHYTALEDTQTSLNWLCSEEKQVSSHYLICRTGTIYQLVQDSKRAWHAGVSRWKEDVGLNDTSLGIELDNNGHEPFASTQMKSLLELLEFLCEKHALSKSNVLGHEDIAPERKKDPGRLFPWEELYVKGFGLARINK